MLCFQEIQSNKTSLIEYINFINKYQGLTINEVCKILKRNVKNFESNLDTFNIKNKGLLGTFVKTKIFGLNFTSNINIEDEIIKIRSINLILDKDKSLKSKERLTLAKIGTNKENNFEDFIKEDKFIKTNLLKEVKNNIIVIFKHSKVENKDDFQNIIFLGCFYSNLFNYPLEYLTQIEKDFIDIKEEINNKTFNTKNQKYLHIHKHGGKKSDRRAIGYKNLFVNKLIEFELIKNNFEKKYWAKKIKQNKELILVNNKLSIKFII